MSRRKRRGTMSKRRYKTIHYIIFFAATVCSNWKLHAPNVWVHKHCQPFLQSVGTTFSQSRRLFWLSCGILCIKQCQKFLSNWQEVLIDRRYFSDQKSRRLLFSFLQLGSEYSVYWIPCLAAEIYHSHNLLAATNCCCKNFNEKLPSVLWL